MLLLLLESYYAGEIVKYSYTTKFKPSDQIDLMPSYIRIVLYIYFLTSIRKLRSLKTAREDSRAVEVAMGINQAYESVEKDIRNDGKRREAKEQEEPIYEVEV